MMRNTVGLLVPLLGVLAATATYAQDAAAASQATVVLFDRSGSMAFPCAQNQSLNKARCGLDALTKPRIGDEPGGRLTELNQTIPDPEIDYYFWEFRDLPTDPSSTVTDPAPDYIQRYDDVAKLPRLFADMASGGQVQVKGINTLITEAINRATPGDETYEEPLGGTPLAQAYCRAVKFLNEVAPDLKKHILLVSDGKQDPTAVIQQTDCNGPDSTSAHPFPESEDNLFAVQRPTADLLLATAVGGSGAGLLVGSWQANMLDMATSGTLHILPASLPSDVTALPLGFQNGLGDAFQLVGNPAESVIVEVMFLKDLVPGFSLFSGPITPISVEPGSRASTDPVLNSLAASAAASSTNDFVGFLSGLSHATGGRLTINGHNSAANEEFGEHALAGDADDSGCVDSHDVSLIQQFFGQKIQLSDSLSLGADVNYDGSIDELDYALVKRQFGQGCDVPPEPAPVLRETLLGFGDATSWLATSAASSDMSLGLTALSTEGATALRVRGTGWKSFQSVPFDGSFFDSSAVTSTLALDVFVPEPAADQYWLGSVLMSVTCPSANIWGAFLGNIDLSNLPRGQFSTLRFNVPSAVKNAIRFGRDDVSITITVNSFDTGHVVDNLRFVQ